MRFADAATRLAGQANVLAGWMPDIFWNATPAELAAVIAALAGPAGAAPAAGDIARLKEQFPDG